MKFLSLVVGLVIFVLTIGSSAWAQNTADGNQKPRDTILILDASGSMWGQIGGVNKIVIAKDVVEELVRALPDEQPLGLVAYGHRKKGDCSDIETLSDVGTRDNRPDLIAQIRALSPKGKTPLARSIEHAATQLNYTKNAADVILVSDGLETCEVDPCALARQLEATGLDFTVHVVGFDVTQEERKGLQCIAAETGGQFLPADNAEDLANALSKVAIAPKVERPDLSPEPVPQTVALKATILLNGPDIQSKLNWVIVNKADGSPVFLQNNTGYAETQIVPGEYIAKAEWLGWQGGAVKRGEVAFKIKPSQPKVVTVPIDLELPLSLEGPPSALEGEAIAVRWVGPDDLGAYISINRPDDGPRDFIHFSAAQKARDAFETQATEAGSLDSDGDGAFTAADEAALSLQVPSRDGQYELRYTLNEPRVILARRPIEIMDGGYALDVPDTVDAGASFKAQWSGNLTEGDFLTIVPKGSEKVFANGVTARVKQGSDVQLNAPAEPGDYEVRYILANPYTPYEGMQRSVQASVPLVVKGVTASVSGPAQAIGGSTISIYWEGPEGWDNDRLSIVPKGSEKFNRGSFVGLKKRGDPLNPATLRLPDKGGEYDIIYLMEPGGKVLARQPLRITLAAASVTAPATVKMGTSFAVSYTGEAFKGDRVVIVPADRPDDKMWNITGAYGFFVKPDAADGTIGPKAIRFGLGSYELRYVTGKDNLVIARSKIDVLE